MIFECLKLKFWHIAPLSVDKDIMNGSQNYKNDWIKRLFLNRSLLHLTPTPLFLQHNHSDSSILLIIITALQLSTLIFHCQCSLTCWGAAVESFDSLYEAIRTQTHRQGRAGLNYHSQKLRPTSRKGLVTTCLPRTASLPPHDVTACVCLENPLSLSPDS